MSRLSDHSYNTLMILLGGLRLERLEERWWFAGGGIVPAKVIADLLRRGLVAEAEGLLVPTPNGRKVFADLTRKAIESAQQWVTDFGGPGESSA